MGDRERAREGGEKGEEVVHMTEVGVDEEEGGGTGPPYVWPCLGELRNESGSKAGGRDGGGGGGGEGEEGGEGGETAAAGGGGEQREVDVLEEDGVKRRPPITGEGRRVSERVVTPGACTGGGGREGGAGEEEEVGGEGEVGLMPGGGRAGESSNCPEPVNDRLLRKPASSALATPPPPPSPVMAAVAMTMTAFCGSATVVRLPWRSP